MKLIKTEAIAPQPLRIEGAKTDAEEVFVWDEAGNFIGTEWRMTQAAVEKSKTLENQEVDITA